MEAETKAVVRVKTTASRVPNQLERRIGSQYGSRTIAD